MDYLKTIFKSIDEFIYVGKTINIDKIIENSLLSVIILNFLRISMSNMIMMLKVKIYLKILKNMLVSIFI